MSKMESETQTIGIPLGYKDICYLADRGCKGACNPTIFETICNTKDKKRCHNYYLKHPIINENLVMENPKEVKYDGQTFLSFMKKTTAR